MKQSRLMSLAEAIANVAVGYGVAVVTQILIFPVFGLHTTLAQNLKMGAVFTVLCRARHNTVYAERMIMRSVRHLWSAPRGFVAVVTPHNSDRCSPRQASPSAYPEQ
jgi:hypothetical protein